MRKQIQLWGTRTLSLVLVAFAIQHWGTPMYKQHFIPKEKTTFVPTATVLQGPFAVSFHEIGVLQAENSRVVGSTMTGKIIRLVPEGTVVKAGDVLVELDTADIQREVRQAELAYQNALASVSRAKSELDILKASNETDRRKTEAQYEFDKNELERAKQELARQQRLVDKKLVPGSALDKAEYDVRAKELALQKSEMDIELKTKELAEKESQKMADVRKEEFAANISLAALEEVKSRLSGAFIKAPADGMVVLGTFWSGDSRRKIKEGDNASPRQSICELPDLSKMQVSVKVGEADAPKLRIGLPTRVRLEAVPNKLFHGSIREISSLATESNPWEGGTPGRRNFEVIIALKESDPRTLKPGMTADVEFVCDSIQDAVYVPIEAVTEHEGKTWVFVKNGKDYLRKAVKLGKSNDNHVVVTEGLTKGMVIALTDPTRPIDELRKPGSQKSGDDDEADEKKKPAPIPGMGEA